MRIVNFNFLLVMRIVNINILLFCIIILVDNDISNGK